MAPARLIHRGPPHIPRVTEPLALYIHWPFCLAKCPYCDFNSHVRARIPQQRFAAALRAELAWEAARLGRRTLGSIFFGGGTPSLMEPDTAAALIADAHRLFEPAPGLEVTLEANPTSVEAGRLAAFREAGVNRISLGVQSLEDAPLRMLGRQHSAAEAVAALEVARRIFPRLSFDLIYARPGQTLAAWQAELDQRTRLGRRPSLAVSADDRARHRVRGAAPAAAGWSCPARTKPLRCTRRRRKQPPGTAWQQYEISNYAVHPAPRAVTTWPTGATATTRASGRVRMAASCSAATAPRDPPPPRAGTLGQNG